MEEKKRQIKEASAEEKVSGGLDPVPAKQAGGDLRMKEDTCPIAVVTGASRGIGRAICRVLLEEGYEVYGIGRNFSSEEQSTAEGACRFHPVVCDLLKTDTVFSLLKPIRKTGRVSLLVNNAGVAYYGLHEELSEKMIRDMVRTNLELPMLLTEFFLRELKKQQGRIVNISSVTATHPSPHGAAYGATKAGLLHFSRSLFEEARRYGVGVTTILPDLTDTALYRHADFGVAEDTECFLTPEEVAEAVRYSVQQRAGMNLSEILLRPQKNQIQRKKGQAKDRAKE